jgi:hypothetical protein
MILDHKTVGSDVQDYLFEKVTPGQHYTLKLTSITYDDVTSEEAVLTVTAS